MARKGNVQWHVFKREEITSPDLAEEYANGTIARENHFALREDGKIIRKLLVERNSLFDTRRIERHDYGWKLQGKARPDALAFLQSKGYVNAK